MNPEITGKVAGTMQAVRSLEESPLITVTTRGPFVRKSKSLIHEIGIEDVKMDRTCKLEEQP